MPIINNEFLGPLKQVKGRQKPISPLAWVIGNVLGFFPFLLGIFLRAVCVYFIWNLFITQLKVPHLNFQEAYAVTSVLFIATLRYPTTDMSQIIESFLDLSIKTLLVSCSCLAFNYLL
jgi:hypothetical protein